jgi:hypothetical protein
MTAWNPEIAPQAITIKIKGSTGPPITGPPPLMNAVRRASVQLDE